MRKENLKIHPENPKHTKKTKIHTHRTEQKHRNLKIDKEPQKHQVNPKYTKANLRIIKNTRRLPIYREIENTHRKIITRQEIPKFTKKTPNTQINTKIGK